MNSNTIQILFVLVASVTNTSSRRAVLHKKFTDRRTQSHDSDPNILESSSSSEDLKTMADVSKSFQLRKLIINNLII